MEPDPIDPEVSAERPAPGSQCNYSIRGRRLAVGFCALLFASLYALLPSLLQARNPKAADYWDISGDWQMGQSNHTTMNLHVQQEYENASVIHGQASYSAAQGPLEGTLNGTHLSFKIYWNNGDLALYEGTIDSRGIITGTAYVKGHQDRKISWFSSRPMTWSPWPGDVTIPGVGTFPPGQVPRTNRPIKKLKITPTTTPRTAPIPTPPPQAQGAPAISARPSTITLPAGQAQGKSLLIWDGGKDHPYAEIWVKVDDQDETKVLEAGKGTRQVTVERGKTYLYILTDSGQRLATVTVRAK